MIDICGFGGQALAGAPEPLQALEGHLPADHATLAERLLGAFHAGLGRRVGVDARRVVAQQTAPLVALAMLAADGVHGFAGRGLYRPPLALFESRTARLSDRGARDAGVRDASARSAPGRLRRDRVPSMRRRSACSGVL